MFTILNDSETFPNITISHPFSIPSRITPTIKFAAMPEINNGSPILILSLISDHTSALKYFSFFKISLNSNADRPKDIHPNNKYICILSFK